MASSIVLFMALFLLLGTAQAGVITTRACTFTWPAGQGDTCASIAAFWGLTEAQFILWNPSVGVDCVNGVVAGTEYCVEFEGDAPTQPPSTTTTTSSTSSITSNQPFPTPIQGGVISTCTSFYIAKSGDDCSKIVAAFGTFSFADFLSWNPAVGEGCGGLWLGYNYCVAVPGTPTTRPTSTSSTGLAPTPTQTGIIDTCINFHKVASGDTCGKIVDAYKTFTLEDLWNPAVGTDCSGLWLGYYVCVGIPGTPTTPPTTTPTVPTGPTPTQDGINKACKAYYKAVSGDYCQKIADENKISLAQFVSWNPAAKEDCSGLWLGYYYCVKV